MTAGSDPDQMLAKARAGDESALVDLLEHFGPSVRARIASKLTGPWRSSLDEDDVMQVTYLEAVMRMDKFVSGGAKEFGNWLSRLAENNLIDAMRAMESAKRPSPGKRVTPMAGADSMVALVELLGATSTTPSVNVARNEMVSYLEDTLGKLPPDYETVIRLYDLQGKPPAQVAKELGRSEGAVFMLRARAHDRLKELLGGTGSKFFSFKG